MKNKKQNYYYDIATDLEKYPDAWCYIIFGGRNTGKTYSTLWNAYDNNIPFAFIKREVDDVKLLCTTSKKTPDGDKLKTDFSPFKSLNRDKHINVKAFPLYGGMGGFWKCDNDDKPMGSNIGYILALANAIKYKGFDLSDCDFMIFDEFVPKIYERRHYGEGERILDLYKTIGRDREHRGLPALKLIALANADNAASPLTEILEITDDIVEMSLKKEAVRYIEDRGILIHRIIDNKDFMEKEKQSAIYKAMAGTAWGAMSAENYFAYNDFSAVVKTSLKRYTPMCAFKYKNTVYYIYCNYDRGTFYITKSRGNTELFYDLNLDAGKKRFYYDYILILQDALMTERLYCETYTLYNMINNYKDFFRF